MKGRINRLSEELFRRKDLLSIYFTAGYPALHDTTTIIKALQDAGADLIEVGVPFSDPVADGETIQRSSQIALNNGMTLELLFEQLKQIRHDVQVPLILMGYLNPIYKFGIDRFCDTCEEVGVDGLIIPDLPLAELESTYNKLFQDRGLRNILLVSPQTPTERIEKVDQLSTGFNYLVSSSSTTGKTGVISQDQVAYISRVKQMSSNPCLVGFGISDHESFSSVCSVADGAIIGSAFIKALNPDDLEESIHSFIRNIKQ